MLPDADPVGNGEDSGIPKRRLGGEKMECVACILWAFYLVTPKHSHSPYQADDGSNDRSICQAACTPMHQARALKITLSLKEDARVVGRKRLVIWELILRLGLALGHGFM